MVQMGLDNVSNTYRRSEFNFPPPEGELISYVSFRTAQEDIRLTELQFESKDTPRLCYTSVYKNFLSEEENRIKQRTSVHRYLTSVMEVKYLYTQCILLQQLRLPVVYRQCPWSGAKTGQGCTISGVLWIPLIPQIYMHLYTTQLHACSTLTVTCDGTIIVHLASPLQV